MKPCSEMQFMGLDFFGSFLFVGFVVVAVVNAFLLSTL